MNRVTDVQHDLALVQQGDRLIFKPPQRNIGFGEEVPGTAGRVQKFQPCQLPLKCLQFGLTGFFHRHRRNFRKLRLQAVQKQRVDYLVDILNAGVVHPTGAPGFRVQSALEHGTENGGADSGPIEVLTAPVQNQVDYLIAQAGDGNILISE